MARIETDPNYTTPTFPRATAPTDIVELEDIQQLAAAFSTHNHATGKGIAVGGIAAGVITGTMISDGSITGPKLAANSVDSTKILDGTIANADLADNCITSSKIVDGQVTSAKLETNIAIAGTLSVAGATTLSGTVTASNITMTPTGVIRLGTAAAQQSGGLNLANSNPVSWRNAGNTADISMIIDTGNHLSLVGWADDGGSFTPAGAAPNALRIIINGTAWRAPLYPMP